MNTYKSTHSDSTGDSSPVRAVSINIRARQRQRDLIDRAAEALGKNRSDFMLETACREAEAVLLDKRVFVLDGNAYKQFVARLNAPAKTNRKLQDLLETKAPWGK
ncbi:MAG: DUF1778 domain-containing protein [Elusimicrobiota bacterium]